MAAERKPLSQNQMLRGSLRPGNQVDIIINRDDGGGSEVRASHLYDITEDNYLILAQTSPPLNRTWVGKSIEVTFLFLLRSPGQERWVRTTYTTPVVEVNPAYPVAPEMAEPVIITAAPTKLSEGNLRLHYRLDAPLGVNVNIVPKEMHKLVERQVEDFTELVRHELLVSGSDAVDAMETLGSALKDLVEQVKRSRVPRSGSVLDISLGGAAFSYPQNWEFPAGNPLELTLSWDDLSVEIKARVVRGGKMKASGTRAPSFTSVQFVDLDADTREALREFFTVLVRKELARRSGLDE